VLTDRRTNGIPKAYCLHHLPLT